MQACYELPSKPDSSRYSFISIGCNPTMHWDATEKGGQAMEMPFYYPHPDERIQSEGISCFPCYLIHPHTHSCTPIEFSIILDHKRFAFFANVSTFLKSSFPYRLVPWREWGPPNTRWFRSTFTKELKHALCGYRALDTVLCEPLGDDDSDGTFGVSAEKKLRVLDFNPNSVRRSAMGQIKGWKCRAVTKPSTTITGGSYDQDIISSLPYTEVVSQATFHSYTVLMDSSRIFLPEVSEPSVPIPDWADHALQNNL
jgi:hypothetical protein